MASNAIQGHGTLLAMDDGALNFTTILELRNMSLPKLSRKANDVSPHNESYEQILASALMRTGEISVTLGFIPGSATHGTSTGFLSVFIANLVRTFRVTFTNAQTWQCKGQIIDFQPTANVDSDLVGTLTIKLTATPTLA